MFEKITILIRLNEPGRREMLNENEMLEEMIRNSGDTFLMNTLDCVTWKQEKGSCEGCPSLLSCDKTVKLKIAFLTIFSYQPQSFEDFQKMTNGIDELTKMILGAKTKEELDGIPMV